MPEKVLDVERLSVHNMSTTYVRIAELSKEPDLIVTIFSYDYKGAIWSTNVAVVSNPTSDKSDSDRQVTVTSLFVIF